MWGKKNPKQSTKDSNAPTCPPAKKSTSKAQVSNERGEPLLQLPHSLRIIGPKHVKILMQFLPSAVVYSVTSLILVTYVSDWKTVLQYVPYYNGKYNGEESSDKND